MKHPFRPTTANLIYASVAALFIMLLNIKIYGLDRYSLGMGFGSIFGILLIATLIAVLFWFVLGRKQNGGTTTFNIVLTFLLFGSMIEFRQKTKERQKPANDIVAAVSEYKESSLLYPDSTDANYEELSTDVKKAMDDLLKTSIGDEKKVFLIVNEFFKKSDSINVVWNNAHNAFSEPRILDFTLLNNSEEFKFQKEVVQEYVDQSENLKNFTLHRVDFLKDRMSHLDKSNKTHKDFLVAMAKKDSIQQPVFIPYINAHIDYGTGINELIDILERTNGKWTYEDETIIFEDYETEVIYNEIINAVIENEDIVNELSEKLIEIM